MLSDGLKYMTLNDKQQGEILLAVAVPRGDDPWGVLASLRGTSWEDQITVVPGSVMSDAVHGWATPLMRIIGIETRYRLRKINEDEGRCALTDGCAMATIHCRPGPKLPECFEAPLPTPEGRHTAALVALAWKEGRYVLVVEGKEW